MQTAKTTKNPTTKLILPWKVRLSIFLLSAFSDASRRSDDTINRTLFNIIDRKLRPSRNPVDGVSSSDVSVDSTRNLWFCLFVPSSSAAAASLPVIVFFHGGGFSFMSPASIPYDTVCRLFCRSFPAVVVSVNYRLSPEHRFPSQYDDGFDVLKFLDQNADVLCNSADVTKCFLAGDSAGGNLAHHVAVRVAKERLRVVKVIGLVSIQPFFGGEERTESEIRLKRVPLISLPRTDWHWRVFLPDGSNRDHEVVNVSGPNAVDISDLDYPNTLVIMGGFDPLQDWQRRYYEWLRKSGKEAQLVEYPNMFHGFYVFPELPEVSQFLAQVKNFVTKQMSNVN
ncbi:Alpha/Beta hydrolase fold [Sesbania bispinosa]|nr:Alpha/Beta hydrolase fold [Sesbania bispinosa]